MELPPQPGAGPDNTGNEQASAQRPEAHKQLREDQPRIYVASLSDYNAGVLHGEWIDADQDPEELQHTVNKMLARSPTDASAEEFATHDFEGFGRFTPSEYDSLDWISRVARGITEHGLAFAAWADFADHDEEALTHFEDAYLGTWPSVTDYTEELLDDLGYLHDLEEHVPEVLAPYVHVDIDAFAHDLEVGGDITAVEHARGVWIFDGRG